jgi:hypothetical protein
MSSYLLKLNALEIIFWLFFYSLQVSWVLLSVNELVLYLYKVFRVEDTDRLLREVEELRCQKTEVEKSFDKNYCSKDYVLFVNEK